MRTLNLIGSVVLIIAAAGSAGAYCDGHPTVQEEFKASALVFIGKVINQAMQPTAGRSEKLEM